MPPLQKHSAYASVSLCVVPWYDLSQSGEHRRRFPPETGWMDGPPSHPPNATASAYSRSRAFARGKSRGGGQSVCAHVLLLIFACCVIHTCFLLSHIPSPGPRRGGREREAEMSAPDPAIVLCVNIRKRDGGEIYETFHVGSAVGLGAADQPHMRVSPEFYITSTVDVIVIVTLAPDGMTFARCIVDRRFFFRDREAGRWTTCTVQHCKHTDRLPSGAKQIHDKKYMTERA